MPANAVPFSPVGRSCERANCKRNTYVGKMSVENPASDNDGESVSIKISLLQFYLLIKSLFLFVRGLQTLIYW